jgi:ferredoxin
MKRLEIIKGDEKAEIYFSGRPLLSSVLEKAGFPIDSPCGGKGKCGKCALEVFGEVSAPTDEEIKHKTRLV